MIRFKYVILLVLAVLILSCNAFAADYMTSEGETMQDAGEGEYVTSGGGIMQTEDLGEGESLTSDDRLIQDEGGSGDYLVSDGETLRDMGDED